MKYYHYTLVGLIFFGAGCNNQVPQSFQSTNSTEVNYASGDVSIQMDTEHSLIRLAEYTSDQEGMPYPKVKRQLRSHDVLYQPYQVQHDVVTLSDDGTVSLGNFIKADRVHPEAIGFQLVFTSEAGSVTTSLFSSDIHAGLKENTLQVAALPKSIFAPITQRNIGYVHALAREILPMSQGQTFHNITLPKHSILEFNMAYAPVFSGADASIPLTFSVTLINDSGGETLFSEALATDHNMLQDIRQGWVTQSIDLSKYAGQTVSIRLETSTEATSIPVEQGSNLSIGLWGSPVIYTPRSAIPDAKPNVIFISLDTLRADHLGSYGYGRDTSPNIDAFAKEAILFEECIAVSSWTLPAHASIFTGLPPFIHGAHGVEGWRMTTVFDTLTEVLHDADYTTAAFTDGVVIAGAKGFHQGFDLYSDGITFDHPLPIGTAEGVIAQTVDWLDSHQDTPFFLFVHSYEIHDLYQPPAPFLGKYAAPEPAVIYPTDRKEIKANMPSKKEAHLAIARYDEGIAYTDAVLEKLFSYLNKSGLNENTIVVLFADHGEEFYDHDDITHGKTLYREVLHVPLIIRMPGTTPPVGRVSRLVSQLDLFATIVEALGIDYIPPATSHSLMPLIQKNAYDKNYQRRHILSQLLTRSNFNVKMLDKSGNIGRMELSVQNDLYKYILITTIWEPDSILAEAWDTFGDKNNASLERHILDSDLSKSGESQKLFFLSDDPLEKNNRVADHPKIVEQMRELLRESLDQVKLTIYSDDVMPVEETQLSDEEQDALEAMGYL